MYDLSRNLDSKFREAYLGGIVDVYRPHLEGKGYYYDINSLYPTAMCKPMPVGQPLIIKEFDPYSLNSSFFGFVDFTITSNGANPNASYIGLLPIKWKGRLICPQGTFRGLPRSP